MREQKLSNWRTDLRIIWAITAKDILEAVKNRYIISVVIAALFIAVLYSFMPTLTALDNPPNVLIYDADNSFLGTQLKNSQALEVYIYSSKEIMLSKLERGEVPELGLIIPANFTEYIASEDGSQKQPELTGYVLYWVSDAEITKLTQAVSTEITLLVGKPVEIRMNEERLIPQPDHHTLGNWVGAALVFVVIYTSLGLISNMMLEEKQTRTLDVLLVSPASSWHVMLAKAITGLFYCLIGMTITLVINQKIVLHWEVLVPALILGALFSISLGLIVGSIVNERGQLSLCTFGLLIPLFIPVFLSILNDLFPQWLTRVIALIPSVTFFHLLQISFSGIPPVSTLLKEFAWLLMWAILGLALAIWIFQRRPLESGGNKEIMNKKMISARSSGSQAIVPTTIPNVDSPTAADVMSIQQALGQSKLLIKPTSGLRIIQIIAAKDIRESIHNKTILSIMVGITLLIVGNAVLLRGLTKYTGSKAMVSSAGTPVLAIMVSITLITLGVSLVPLLMLEEKEAHTLETLLVSPAHYIQVVAGKALAGSAYCLSGVLVILLAYHFLIIHWELALLALLLGTSFVVALGLLVGMISNNPTSIGMWSAVILLILIIPATLAGLVSLDRVPWIDTLMTYWPSTAIVKLFNLSLVNDIPSGMVIKNSVIIISAAVVLYLLTWWMVRRSDLQGL